MVEGAALEMLFRGNFNEGSNPSLSVITSPCAESNNYVGVAPPRQYNYWVLVLVTLCAIHRLGISLMGC